MWPSSLKTPKKLVPDVDAGVQIVFKSLVTSHGLITDNSLAGAIWHFGSSLDYLWMVLRGPKTHKAVVPLTIFGLFATFQDPNYSFQSCVLSWVAKEAGCHLDWFRSDQLNWKPSCRKKIFQQITDQRGGTMFSCRGHNQLSERLVQGSLGELLSSSSTITSCFFLIERRAGWSSVRWPAVCPSVLSGPVVITV